MIVDDMTTDAAKRNVHKSKDGLNKPTRKSPLVNTTVSVRNIKVHVAEMSADDNAGFKEEYNVMSNLILPLKLCFHPSLIK